MKTIYKVFEGVVSVMLAAFLLSVMFFGILTPDKTECGKFTDVIKYWTDDVYFANNFESPVCHKERK